MGQLGILVNIKIKSVQSKQSIIVYIFTFQAAHYGNRAADVMGCIIGGVEHKIKCLQGLSTESFVKLSQVFLINLKPNEDIDYAESPFLPMSPMNALRSGNYSKNVQVRYSGSTT